MSFYSYQETVTSWLDYLLELSAVIRRDENKSCLIRGQPRGGDNSATRGEQRRSVLISGNSRVEISACMLAHLACPFGLPVWLAHLACPFGLPIGNPFQSSKNTTESDSLVRKRYKSMLRSFEENLFFIVEK